MLSQAQQQLERGATALDDLTAKRAAAEAIEGARVLQQVYDYLGRFVAYPSTESRVAHTLWIAHTHLMEEWETTPRIAFLSPEPGSGKTRALEITETLVPNAVQAINATPAYIFRRISGPEGLPTILFDEIDTVFGPKAKENEELRGIINAGHRRGAMAGRCVIRGKEVLTEELPAYAALAVAGLGNLPDTILTRSVIVRMRRRAHGEVVEGYRRRTHEHQGHKIRDQLAAWSKTLTGRLRTAWPDMPHGVEDRAADNWEALLSVADIAGGEWPKLGRAAAVSLVTQSQQTTPSLGVRLLSDLRDVFSKHAASVAHYKDGIKTDDIIKALTALDEAPWADMKGKPIDARKLSRLLSQYGVASKSVRHGPLPSDVAKGYTAEDLHDPWSRYLGPAQPEKSVTAVTGVTENEEEVA